MKNLILKTVLLIICVSAYSQKPGTDLLTPTNHALVLIDFEGQMAFPVSNIPIEQLRNNVGIIAGASKIFEIPTVVTTVAEKSFSGPLFPELLESYPDKSRHIDRTSMNTWEDNSAHKAITGLGKKRLVLAGLWTSVCIVDPALSAIEQGYEVYVITDACGDVSLEAHNQAITRMVQKGAVPITSIQYLLELQRDWARQDTYKAVNDLIVKYAGAYGIGVQYARGMLKH